MPASKAKCEGICPVIPHMASRGRNQEPKAPFTRQQVQGQEALHRALSLKGLGGAGKNWDEAVMCVLSAASIGTHA